MSRNKSLRTLKRANKRKRIRKKVLGTAQRPRLAVFRSSKNIYAQLIDDVKDVSLGGVSTLSPDLRDSVSKAKNKTEAAKLVGQAIAKKAKSIKIESAVFDRGGYLYHGRVRAVAEAARETGLKL